MQGSRLVAAAVPATLAGVLASSYALAGAAMPESSFVSDLQVTLDAIVTACVAWVRKGYADIPAVMIGLAAVFIVPVLAVLGLLLRRGLAPAKVAPQPIELPPAPPRDAWIEVEGQEESRRRIGAGMVRIGRQDDNDLCIAHKTVHRYHAVVYPSPDTGFIILDLGGGEGNGIKVNDVAVAQAHLSPGDRVMLGQVQLRFGAADP